MGRSYNLKKPSINKGAAAKPAPTKDFGLISGPIIAAIAAKAAIAKAAVGAAVGAGISAASSGISRSIAGKKQRKLQKEENIREAKSRATEGFASKRIGGGSSRIA